MARTLKNVKNEKSTLQDLDYGEKTEKRGKRDRNTIWPGNFWEILKNVENGNAQCGILGIIRKLKNIENEAQTLYNREYGEEH